MNTISNGWRIDWKESAKGALRRILWLKRQLITA